MLSCVRLNLLFVTEHVRRLCIWRNGRWQAWWRFPRPAVQADWNVFPLWSGWSLGSSV